MSRSDGLGRHAVGAMVQYMRIRHEIQEAGRYRMNKGRYWPGEALKSYPRTWHRPLRLPKPLPN